MAVCAFRRGALADLAQYVPRSRPYRPEPVFHHSLQADRRYRDGRVGGKHRPLFADRRRGHPRPAWSQRRQCPAREPDEFEDEFDDEVDVDSVPEDVYREIDKKLDELKKAVTAMLPAIQAESADARQRVVAKDGEGAAAIVEAVAKATSNVECKEIIRKGENGE